MEELDKLQKESESLRYKELLDNYSQLSAASQMELVITSRELIEQEKEIKRTEQFLLLYRLLDDKSKAECVAYLEALTKDPRYRKTGT